LDNNLKKVNKKKSKVGVIINSKKLSKGEVLCKIVLNQEEIRNLKGHMKNIYLFNPNLCSHPSQINTRGNNGVTKYFKIPLSLRSRKKYLGNLSYQKVETNMFFIFM